MVALSTVEVLGCVETALGGMDCGWVSAASSLSCGGQHFLQNVMAEINDDVEKAPVQDGFQGGVVDARP